MNSTAAVDIQAMECVQDLLVAATSRPGDAGGLVFPDHGQSYDFAELGVLWAKGASVLRRAGIGRGTRVVLMLDNSPAFILGLGALFYAGTIPVLLNPSTAEEQLLELAGMCGATACLSHSSFRSLNSISPDSLSAEALAAEKQAAPLRCKADETAYIIYTSGTTGRMKGTQITHANMLCEIASMARAYALGKEDRHLCILPLYHASALFRHFFMSLYLGARAVIMREFEVKRFWALVDEYRPTYVQAVPTVLTMLCEHPSAPSSAPSLRYIGTASASCPPETIRKFERRFGVLVAEGYGLTETTCGVAINPPDKALRRIGSVGRVHDVFQVEVLDASGHPAPARVEGEIRVQGRAVSPGYLNAEEQADGVLQGGVLRTGDLGYFDEDGYLYVTGRTSSMIYRGGFKVAPQEVEAELVAHPAVEAAVVFGVPHDYLGEDVMAYVLPAQGVEFVESDVRRYLRAKLVRYKVPTRILPREDLFQEQRLKISRAKFRDFFLESERLKGIERGQAASKPVKPRAFLVGNQVYLRSITDEDIKDPIYLDNVMTREYGKLAGAGRFPQSEVAIREYWRTALNTPTHLGFTVCDMKTDERLGNMTLIIDWYARRAEIGRFIYKKYQHMTAYTLEAVELLMEYVFEDLKLHRMCGAGANPSSIPSFLKCGWTYEGRMRSNDLLDGQWRDQFIMGILEDEYRAWKQGLPVPRESRQFHDTELLEKVVAIVAEAFDADPQSLDCNSGPQDINGWDSLGQIILWSLLEERFNIQLKSDDLIDITSTGDIAFMVQTKLALSTSV